MIQKSQDTFDSFIKHYWQYYRELEDEIIATRRYVDFDQGNFSTFSVEYLKLYQAICSEIDVLGKAIAHEIDPMFQADDRQNNILKWWLVLQDNIKYPQPDQHFMNIKYLPLESAEVDFFNYIPIRPWHNFRTEVRPDKNGRNRTELVKGYQTPGWWADYNSVKHNRTSQINSGSKEINYTKANLKNVVYSISALFILELAYMYAVGTKDDVEAFADYGNLFYKEENATTSEIDVILNN